MKPVLRTLHSFLIERASSDPDKVLLFGPECRMTIAEVLHAVEAAAGSLIRNGVRPGDRIALRTHRDLNTALAILALQLTGALAVLIDARQDALTFAREQDIPVSMVLDPNDLEFSGNVSREMLPEVDPRSPGFLIFTSGSTGKPKGVMLSQYNLVNNLVDSQPLGRYHYDDIALGALPMDHVFGLVLLAGICVLGYSICFPETTDIA